MIKIDHFNILPPRPNDIIKLRHILASGGEYKLTGLVLKSKLTKTQVLCSLEHMINSGEVRISSSSKAKIYALATTVKPSIDDL